MIKFRPLHDRILIRRINIEEKTKGGIFLPESVKEKPLEGIIVAIGDGRVIDNKIIKSSLKIGDHVIFAKYAETEININNEKLILVKEDDILGIME